LGWVPFDDPQKLLAQLRFRRVILGVQTKNKLIYQQPLFVSSIKIFAGGFRLSEDDFFVRKLMEKSL